MIGVFARSLSQLARQPHALLGFADPTVRLRFAYATAWGVVHSSLVLVGRLARLRAAGLLRVCAGLYSLLSWALASWALASWEAVLQPLPFPRDAFAQQS